MLPPDRPEIDTRQKPVASKGEDFKLALNRFPSECAKRFHSGLRIVGNTIDCQVDACAATSTPPDNTGLIDLGEELA
jgi:hypothetical protein